MQPPDIEPATPDASNDTLSLGTAIFPTAHSLLSADALLAGIDRAYTIEPLKACTLIRSYVNDVYAITAAVNRYVLKVYRAGWRSWSEIAWEIDVLAHLAMRDVAVATAIPRNDGRRIGTVRAPEGVRYVVLFTHAADTKPTPPFTAALYYHFGQATAHMHHALDDFASPHARIPLDLAYLLDRPLAALRPWLAHRPSDWSFLVRLATKISTRIRALAATGLDWGVCHGDLSLDNVHVAANQQVTFYDFDSGGPGWRASDLYGVFQYQPRDTWMAFLDGYRAVRSFAPADVAAVPYLVAARGIWDMGHRVRHWTAWSGRWVVTEAYWDGQMAQWRAWDTAQLDAEA